jgi:hypothetical protein
MQKGNCSVMMGNGRCITTFCNRCSDVPRFSRERTQYIMSLGTILLIVIILLLIGSLPSWPYSSGWGYYPSGGLGLLVVILLILVLLRRI